MGSVLLGGSSYTILDATVTITNGIKVYEEECNGQDYPSDYGTPSPRMVEAAMKLYFRPGDTARFKDALDFNSLAIVIPWGTVAGSTCTLNLPQTKVKAPKISGNAERIMDLTIEPFATTATAEDEVSLVYT